MGFKKVSLTTAYPLSAFDDLVKFGITVITKDPPWTLDSKKCI